jgi:hypothetical protein
MSTVIKSRPPAITPANGRPKSLDSEAKKCICALVAQGFSIKQAATYVACHRETIRNERRRDPRFDANLQRALAMADIQPLDLIHRAAKTSWRAAAWLVEFRRRVKKEDREARDARKQKAASPKENAIAPTECETEGKSDTANETATFSPSPPIRSKPRPARPRARARKSLPFPNLRRRNCRRPSAPLMASRPINLTAKPRIDDDRQQSKWSPPR